VFVCLRVRWVRPEPDGVAGFDPPCRGPFSPLYTTREGMGYERERERVPASPGTWVIVDPPGLVIAALVLHGRVHHVARSAERRTWRHLR